MSIFLSEIKKTTVACHRKKHQQCKNSKEQCECECHVVERMNRGVKI